MKFLALTALFLSLTGLACDGQSFLPENDLRIPVGAKFAGGISENDFNAVIDEVETAYAPAVARAGMKLNIMRMWEDANVNASARVGGTVKMYGGLARHSTITKDGFALVLCHELGHLIGGAPTFSTKLSAEAQSDYFATLKCLRHVFGNDNNAAIVKKLGAPAALTTSCSRAHRSQADRDLCVRSGMAAVSVTNLFVLVHRGSKLNFDTPDKTVVGKTNLDYPSDQCRLDTFHAGALCEKSHNEDVSQTDEVKGTCHSSTGHKVGVRPACWFKSASL